MQRYNEALADLNRAIDLDSQSAMALGNRGEVYRLLEQYDAAIADLNRAIDLDSQAARSLGNRGEVYRLLGQYDAALLDFNRAIELLPDNEWLLHHRHLVEQALVQPPTNK